MGLDCYTCHGDVSLDHTKDTSQIWLSKKRRDDALAVTSICAQCHLRGAVARSTGRAYPNNFIAGDNLFLDYSADFVKADDGSLNPGDRHVWRNVRDVTGNASGTTCLSCHSVHGNSSAKHRRNLLRLPQCGRAEEEGQELSDIEHALRVLTGNGSLDNGTSSFRGCTLPCHWLCWNALLELFRGR